MRGLARELYHFLSELVSGFFEHRGFENAASLTYTTLLSLVPLLTVGFALFSAFPVAERMGDGVRDFVFQYFVPAAGQVVQQYLESFIDKASKLSGPSFLFLIVIALLMMRSIESALNGIWETHRKRGSVQKFLVYWALISLGPLLVAISLAATSYLVSLPLMMEAEESIGLGSRLILVTPVLASMTAFSLIYLIIPNHAVPVRYAFAGGLVAAILFDLANRGFGLYVTSFTSYQEIYGALSVIPIFLIWIYLSWIIFLLGAEFAHCLERCRLVSTHGRERSSELETALHLLETMRLAYAAGEEVTEELLLERAAAHGGFDHGGLLQKLENAGYILRTENGGWISGRDLRDITLMDLYRQLETPLPVTAAGQESSRQFDRKISQANKQLEQLFTVSLDELIQNGQRNEKAGD